MLTLPAKVILLDLCLSWEHFPSNMGFLEITPELRDFAGMGNAVSKDSLAAYYWDDFDFHTIKELKPTDWT